MENDEISRLSYDNGELIEKKIFNFSLWAGVIFALIMIFFKPFGHISYTTKVLIHLFGLTPIGGWLKSIPFLLIEVFIFIYGLKSICFYVYKFVFKIKPEIVVFTNQAIISSKRQWQLINENHELTQVFIDRRSKPYDLEFKGKMNNVKNDTENYHYSFPLNDAQLIEAEKLVAYFQNEIMLKANPTNS